jgi:aspartate/methionine/tyrosine aminotransferase
MDMPDFSNANIRLDILKKRAFNYRWAEVPEGVIPLTAADIDFPCAPEIINDLTDYIKEGYLSYTPKLGFPELREGISRALFKRKNERISSDFVLPIDSVARAMYIITEAFLCPGDEVIIFDPVDYLFKQSVLAAGGVPVLFPTVIRNGKIDFSNLESYITPKTKMLGLCNPHNPLGMVYPTEDLDCILSVCNKHDLWIMNDEIWSDIVYTEAEFQSITQFGDTRNRKTISTWGFSKSFGIAGLRAGCVYCQDEENFLRIVDKSAVMTTAGGIASLSQIAAISCVDKCYYWVDEFLVHLKNNRDYALERIAVMPNISCHKPNATYLLFPDIRKTGMKSNELADFLKEKYKLAIVPGSDEFFGPGAEGHIRICFATSRKMLEEGLNRLEAGLKYIDEKILGKHQ